MPHRYIHNIQAFLNEDAVSFYLLGAFITDGCVSKNGCSLNAEIKSKDKDWLTAIKDIISPQSPIKKVKNSNCHRLRICNKQIATWLIEHGCIPNKSLKVEMPQIPSQYLRDFLRGCIDGDGSINMYSRSNGRSNKKYLTYSCYIVSASKNFIHDLQGELLKVQIHSTVKKKKVKGQTTILKDGHRIIGKHDQYIIQFSGKYCKSVLDFTYYNEAKLYLPRKMKKTNQIRQLLSNTA